MLFRSRSAFIELWKDRQFLTSYSRVIKTEPVFVSGGEGQKVLGELSNIRSEIKEFLVDYIGRLTTK